MQVVLSRQPPQQRDLLKLKPYEPLGVCNALPYRVKAGRFILNYSHKNPKNNFLAKRYEIQRMRKLNGMETKR